jgi:hypothetical protein
MKTLPKILSLAAVSAAFGLGMVAITPAASFEDGYDGQQRQSDWVGYGENDYGRPEGYGYDRPAYGYDRPAYEVRSGAIALCPPGYHLGRSGALCWPN